MLGKIGRVLGGLLRFLLIAIVLSVLASALLTLAVADLGNSGPEIETPDPLPDWPFVWEIPLGEPGDVDTAPGPQPETDAQTGDVQAEDPGPTEIQTAAGSISSEEIEQRIHVRINEIRSDREQPLLEHDDEIATVARAHSHDMATRDYFSHVNPEGAAPHDRLGDVFPSECRAVGENIAMVGTAGSTDADEIAGRIVEGWMDSEGHRENLLRGGWDRQGIGVYLEDRSAYATQNFCEDR